jgi:2-polyprenyl-3-methyl-5-hydroxy-6-metoxy-1,4-benzoquinol methylase
MNDHNHTMNRYTNTQNIEAYGTVPPEQIANFGDEGDATRQYLLNPAIFALLGEVQGRTILDAGCGQGYLARLLASRGAHVTGVEPSAAFFRYTMEREAHERRGITYVQADLSTWNPPHAAFDAVIANMVFMDIVDWQSALRACVAALKGGGTLIFSLTHPCFEERGAAWKGKGFVAVANYFEERVEAQDVGFAIHRPLSTYLNAVADLGCVLRKVIEPQLDAAIAAQLDAERYARVPGYIVICAMKPEQR